MTTDKTSGEWMPIESAPKDGTLILVWSPMFGGRIFLARWDADKFAAKPRPYWSFSDERIWGKISVRANQPPVWMPLPSPPLSNKDNTDATE